MRSSNEIGAREWTRIASADGRKQPISDERERRYYRSLIGA